MTRFPQAASIAALLLLKATGGWTQQGPSTVEFYSPAVDRTLKYMIALPRDYDASSERYPVLYLIHGFGQNYTHWISLGISDYSEVFDDLIIVMADVGNTYCVNYGQSAPGLRNNWEEYFTQDLVGHVDDNFRTIARREGRAIGGLSMGGHCALTIGLHHPDMFVSIGSTSGALGFVRSGARRLRGEQPAVPAPPAEPPTPEQVRVAEERVRAIGVPGFSTQPERSQLGTRFLTAESADRYDPFLLIQQTPQESLPHIYIDCGTEDDLMPVNREFAQVLLSRDIPFDFMQMPGAHNGDYWAQSSGHMISIQYEVMRRALGERPSFRVR
jgi:S-formylglutathione hydrolase FrmB